MAVLQVVRLGHPALRRPSTDVDDVELRTDEFQRFLEDLADTCVANNGVGIAAPQVGVNKRVIVVNVDSINPRYPGRDPFPLTVVINPVVTMRSDDMTSDWEGDLSADLRGIVPRSSRCVVEGLDRNGNRLKFELSDDFHARVFQHEIDHLDGVFFVDRVERNETLTELPEWETYWKDSQPFGISESWNRGALVLMCLTHELSAWASVVLIPNSAKNALRCAAHYRLPSDWAAIENPLDSASLNARAFLSGQEFVDNDGEVTSPPTDQRVSQHRITASAVVPIPNIGTLEVLANSDEYQFEKAQLRTMQEAALAISTLARTE